VSNRIRVGLLIAAIVLSGLAIWFAGNGEEEPPVPEAASPAAAARPQTVSPRTAVIDASPTEDPPLPPEGLRVRVVANGQPVAGANLSIFLKSGPRHHGRAIPARRAMSRHDGWVIFDGLVIASDDAPEVFVSRPFYFPLQAPFVDGATLTLDPLPPMQGRVLMPDRTPAEGAIVTTEQVSPLEDAYGSMVVAADGRFSLTSPTRGPLVAVRQNASARFEGFDWKSRENPEIEIVLKEDVAFGGKVVGRDRGALAGVDVTVTTGAAGRHFVTSTDGIWKGPLFGAVDATLKFSKQGYVDETRRASQVKAMERAVVLSRPGRIEGTVVTHDGLPAAEATVTYAYDSLEVDENGQFTVDDISAESVELRALLKEALAQQTVDVPEGETVSVRLMLPPVLTEVDLEVVNDFGEAVDDWDAVATPVPATGWTSHAESLMNPKLGLRQGRFRVEVSSEERELSGGVTVDVNPAVDDRPIRVVLHAADGGRGRRSEYDRDPIGSVKVKVVTPSGALAVDATVECAEGMMNTLGPGLFECPFFESTIGALVITATSGDSIAVAHATMNQKEVTLTVQPRRTLRGKVLGTVPPGAYLEVNSSAEQQEEPLTSNDFSLPNRAAVRTIVCVCQRVPASTSQKLGCAVSVGDEVLQIPLGMPGTLQLLVHDEKAKPVESLVLYLDRSGWPLEAPQGRVSMPVVPGSHVLILNAPGSKARAELLFTIRSGQITELGTVKMQ